MKPGIIFCIIGAVALAAITVQVWPNEKVRTCRAVERAAADSVQRLAFTGRMDREDRALFTEVVLGYAVDMRRSPDWSAMTIEHALRDRAGARLLNRELGFMSDREQSEIGIKYGDYSMDWKEARAVLELMKRRFVYSDACKDV